MWYRMFRYVLFIIYILILKCSNLNDNFDVSINDHTNDKFDLNLDLNWYQWPHLFHSEGIERNWDYWVRKQYNQDRTKISCVVYHGLVFVFNELRWKIVVCFVDICGIVGHHCLNILFMIKCSKIVENIARLYCHEIPIFLFTIDIWLVIDSWKQISMYLLYVIVVRFDIAFNSSNQVQKYYSYWQFDKDFFYYSVVKFSIALTLLVQEIICKAYI